MDTDKNRPNRNAFLKALLTHDGFTLTERRPREDITTDRRPVYDRFGSEYDPITFRRPCREFEIFDECELHGLRFIITDWIQNVKGYDWMHRRPIFEWVYTVRVLPILIPA